MGGKSKFYWLLIVLGVTFVAYLPVFRGFFQHDEWQAFGHYISGGEDVVDLFKPYVSHYAPLQRLFFYVYVSVFQLNFFWYALFSLLAHLGVVSLAFIFFLKLFKNYWLGFLSSLVFAIGASGHQATSWIATDINTHGATIFGLAALVVLYGSRRIGLCVLLVIVSLLFKEITIGFLAFIPLVLYLFRMNLGGGFGSWWNYGKAPLAGFLYILVRISMLFSQRPHVDDRVVTETQPIFDVLANMVTFPAKIFAQSVVPTRCLLGVARMVTKWLPEEFTGLYGTTAFDVFVESVTLQVMNWGIFMAGLLVVIYMVKKAKDERWKRVVIFGFLFVVLNSFIYILSPGRAGSVPVVDSRNIYLPSLGTALFLVSSIYLLAKRRMVATTLVILPFLVLNFFGLRAELGGLADRGMERREILYRIKSLYPVLPEKVVFYMVSDKPFYGLPESERIFPFETNLGYTLMVWYLPTENFPQQLVDRDDFLYGLTDEGYMEVGGRGFGYFRNEETLRKVVEENGLGEDSIIAFSYGSDTKGVFDITSQTRTKIFSQ